MSIELKALKIDSTNKGVTGLPDTPALTTEQMQAKFDELPLLCIKQINNIVDDLIELKTAITKAVGVVIPETTSLLRGDGEGGATAAEFDTEPTADSSNPISSGAIFASLAAKSDKQVHLFKRSKQVLAENRAAGYSTDVLWQSDNAVGGGSDDKYFAYNDDTGFLTVKKTGKYLCVVQLRVAGTSDGYSSVFLDLNDAAFENTPGVSYFLSNAAACKYPSYPTHVSVVQLAAGDQLNVRAKFTGANGNTGVTYNLLDTAGFFTVMYLGE